jgi:hypothetical protein
MTRLLEDLQQIAFGTAMVIATFGLFLSPGLIVLVAR